MGFGFRMVKISLFVEVSKTAHWSRDESKICVYVLKNFEEHGQCHFNVFTTFRNDLQNKLIVYIDRTKLGNSI